jgi:hypothetical protein
MFTKGQGQRDVHRRPRIDQAADQAKPSSPTDWERQIVLIPENAGSPENGLHTDTHMTSTTSDAWLDSFIALLLKSTITHNTHEQAIALKQSHLPTRIYKYREDIDRARQNLENNLVWMADPDSYNDPYDSLFKVVQEEAIAEFKKTVHAKTLLIASPSADAKISAIISAGVNFLRDVRKNMKVCSFSAANDSLLMWGHYAHDHKGFCIEYDLEALPTADKTRRNLYPVIYSKYLYDMTPHVKGAVSVNLSDFNPLGPLLSVLHKFEGWSYEREWRLVEFNNDPTPNHIQTVPKATKVFLGSNMDATKAAEIAAICAKQGVEVWKMSLAPDKFELIAKPYGVS